MTRVEIITIGSEILAGHIQDRNFQTITTVLGTEGITPIQHTVVPDERDAIGRVLGSAVKRSQLVIMTGGLGATPDDVTRRVMASLLGRKLIFRQTLLDELRLKYESHGSVMSSASEAMALLPAGAQPLPNRVGIAPGLLLREEDCLIVVLPGVPAEMEVMLCEEVMPMLRAERLTHQEKSATLRTVGLSEVTLSEWVQPLLSEGIYCSFLPTAGRVDLRFWTKGGERKPGDMIAVIEQAAERLGPYCFAQGETSLEAATVALLTQHGLKVAVAESVTGGNIGAALTQVPGSSLVFEGAAVTYSNLAKQNLLGVSAATLESHGAVSELTVKEMANGARRLFNTDIAVATSGIAGPGGGTPEKPVGLVYFGLSTSRFCRSLSAQFGGDRVMIQDRCATLALNMLRLLVLDRLDLIWSGEWHG
jgi:competence/damage-inducible protein CinA-like protein